MGVKTLNQIKKYRTKAGLSLRQLSALTGGEIITSRLSNYEAGLRKLPVEVAITLSPILGASPAELLGIGEMNSEPRTSDSQKTRLIKLLYQLSLRDDHEINKIANMLEAYLEK